MPSLYSAAEQDTEQGSVELIKSTAPINQLIMYNLGIK